MTMILPTTIRKMEPDSSAILKGRKCHCDHETLNVIGIQPLNDYNHELWSYKTHHFLAINLLISLAEDASTNDLSPILTRLIYVNFLALVSKKNKRSRRMRIKIE